MAPGGLAQQAQLDFAAGMFRSIARHLIPQNGAWDIIDGLLDDDGSVYERGGSEYLSTGAFGASARLIWEGYLVPGQRTFIANVDDFGVLDAVDAPLNLGLAGLTVPKRAVEVGGLLFVGGGTLYGGSRKTAAYSTGTVTVTLGSKTVTGAGTTWSTNVDVGMLLRIGGAGRYYVVASVDSNTQITLRDAYEGATAAGQAYSLSPIVTATAPYRAAEIYATAANRLFTVEGNVVRFTPRGSPHSFGATDFHELPQGAAGLGAAGLGDALLIFATNGMWRLDGISQSIVDGLGNAQHRLRRVSSDLLCIGHEGIVEWAGRLVVPCSDGIWLLDGISEPVRISNSIGGLWRTYVQAGYKPGAAQVFRSHYLLPIVDGFGAVKDQIVCRLDRQTQTRLGFVWPWTRLAGHGGNVPAWAVRAGITGQEPRLIGACGADGRILKCNAFFESSHATQKLDADGGKHELEIITRDYAVKDGLGVGTARKARGRYELFDAAADNPTLGLSYADGAIDLTGVAKWDEALWDTGLWAADDVGEWTQAAGQAPEDDGRAPYSWLFTKRARFLRFRLRASGASAKMVLRSLELFSRHSNKA